MLPLRFALREMRGGLHGFYVFIACIALGCMAIAGVGSLAASLADGLARQGQVILGGDLGVHADPARGHAGRAGVPRQSRQGFERRHHARHGANRRWQGHAGGNESRGRRLSAVRRGRARSARRARRRAGTTRRNLRRRGRSCPADAARHQAGRAAHHRQCHVRNPRHARERAGQARRRHRLRAAPAGEPGRLASHRPVAARQSGALALSPASGGQRQQRCRRQGGERAGPRAIPRSRLGHPQPQQRLAATRAQCGALHPVPHHRRLDRAFGRRRRRRQRGEKPSRPPARDDCHHEGARRQRPARVRDLPHAGAVAGGGRRRHRHGAGRDPAVCDFLDLWRDHSAADRAGAASGGTDAGAALWADDGARLRALAARPRP